MSGCFVLTAFFLPFLPTESFRIVGGSDLLRLGIWGVMLAVATAMLTLHLIATINRDRTIKTLGILLLLLSTYSLTQAILRPPTFDYVQTLSLCIFIPLMSLMGVVASRSKATTIWILGGLSGTYIVFGLLNAMTDGINANENNWIPLFPEWLLPPSDPRYQNTTLYCGVFSIIAWFWVLPNTKSMPIQAIALASGVYGVLLISELGGRSAFLATALAGAFQFAISIFNALRVDETGSSSHGVKLRAILRSVAFLAVLSVPFFLTSSLTVNRVNQVPLVWDRNAVVFEDIASSLDTSSADLHARKIEGMLKRIAAVQLANPEASIYELEGEIAEARERYASQKKRTSHRIQMFSAAAEEWLKSKKTFFFGNGPQSFPVAFGKHSAGWYPHNFILESLAEYGIVGAALLLAPLMLMAGVTAKRYWTSPIEPSLDQIAILTIGLMFLLIAFVSRGIQTLWLTYFILFAASTSVDFRPGRNASGTGPEPTKRPAANRR